MSWAARALAWAALPASACPTCLGRADGSGLYDGLWWGIVILLATTFAMLGGFGWLLWRVERAREAAERA